MWQVGVRELRQQASKVLDVVKRGEAVEVTEHGEPVALIVPRPVDQRDALIAAGLLKPGNQSKKLDPPTEKLPGGQSAAASLQEVRGDRL